MSQEALDRIAIHALIATYTINGDRGLITDQAGIFAEDAVLATQTWVAMGRAGIFKALSAVLDEAPSMTSDNAPRRLMRHHLTSSLITFIAPDEARGRTYWINFTEVEMDHSGLYSDHFRRIDGEWRIAHREIRIDWRSPTSRIDPRIVPFGNPPGAPPPLVITG